MAEDETAEDATKFWEERNDMSIQPITNAEIESRKPGRHLVLLFDITEEAVLSQFRPVLTDLDDFTCLDTWPVDYLHVTTKVLGTISENQQGLSADDEHEIIDIARSILGETEQFTIRFPRLNLFPTTVYAEVADKGQFKELNEEICGIQNVPVHDRDLNQFIPHVSLARFRGKRDTEELIDYLERNRSLEIDPVEVSKIELVALSPTEIYPNFDTIETFQFD